MFLSPHSPFYYLANPRWWIRFLEQFFFRHSNDSSLVCVCVFSLASEELVHLSCKRIFVNSARQRCRDDGVLSRGSEAFSKAHAPARLVNSVKLKREERNCSGVDHRQSLDELVAQLSSSRVNDSLPASFARLRYLSPNGNRV